MERAIHFLTKRQKHLLRQRLADLELDIPRITTSAYKRDSGLLFKKAARLRKEAKDIQDKLDADASRKMRIRKALQNGIFDPCDHD